MALRPCLDCGAPTSTTRCPQHNVRRRPDLDTWGWKKTARAIIAASPHCNTPGCQATTDLTVDHIVPTAAGGTAHPSNLQVLCRSCNSSKGAR